MTPKSRISCLVLPEMIFLGSTNVPNSAARSFQIIWHLQSRRSNVAENTLAFCLITYKILCISLQLDMNSTLTCNKFKFYWTLGEIFTWSGQNFLMSHKKLEYEIVYSSVLFHSLQCPWPFAWWSVSILLQCSAQKMKLVMRSPSLCKEPNHLAQFTETRLIMSCRHCFILRKADIYPPYI